MTQEPHIITKVEVHAVDANGHAEVFDVHTSRGGLLKIDMANDRDTACAYLYYLCRHARIDGINDTDDLVGRRLYPIRRPA